MSSMFGSVTEPIMAIGRYRQAGMRRGHCCNPQVVHPALQSFAFETCLHICHTMIDLTNREGYCWKVMWRFNKLKTSERDHPPVPPQFLWGSPAVGHGQCFAMSTTSQTRRGNFRVRSWSVYGLRMPSYTPAPRLDNHVDRPVTAPRSMHEPAVVMSPIVTGSQGAPRAHPQGFQRPLLPQIPLKGFQMGQSTACNCTPYLEASWGLFGAP